MNGITIIAEIGINHNGNMELARELIKQAKLSGADLVKFQLYEVDKVFPTKQVIIGGKNWYEEVKRTELVFEQVEWLANHSNNIGIEFLASAFDIERVGWLEKIGVKRHKVASRVNQDKELINAMIATGKEILLSCQQRSFAYIPSGKNIKVLYCIPLYPTPLSRLEFDKIEFPNEFEGFSDHTIGVEASMVAIARGARIIEKHFCLKRDGSNPDMICSIEPYELQQLVQFTKI